MHASPGDAWRAPAPDAGDAVLAATYASLGQPLAVYAHIHRPFIRTVEEKTVANTGGVSLSYDGDPRASYLLADGLQASIRRVEYDIDREIRAVSAQGFPHAVWIARMLTAARPVAL